MHEKFHTRPEAPRRERAGIRLIAVISLLIATSLVVAGQNPRPPAGAPPTGLAAAAARAQANQVEDRRDMVTLYVTVTDRQGNAIQGLKQGNFVIYEDGVEQGIAEFFMDTSPISLGVVWGPNIPIGDTVPTFLKASAPNTEFFVVSNDTVIAPFSTDPKKAPRVTAQNDLEIFPSGGRDAMHIGLDVLSEASAYIRKVMLVVGRAQRANVVAQPAFGNGVTYDSLANAAAKGEMQIYTIVVQGAATNPFAGLPPPSINPTGRQDATSQFGNRRQPTNGISDIDMLSQNFEETQDSLALDGLAALTGGLSFLIQNTDTGIGNDTSELEAAADEMARSLRVQYRIGYYSTNSKKDGKWRAIRPSLVDMPETVPKKLRIWTKSGYYAAKEKKK